MCAIVIFKVCSQLLGLHPQAHRGSASGPRWGTSLPRPSGSAPSIISKPVTAQETAEELNINDNAKYFRHVWMINYNIRRQRKALQRLLLAKLSARGKEIVGPYMRRSLIDW